MSTIAYVHSIAPEFKDKPPDQITTAIDVAKLSVDSKVWKTKYDAGVAFLAAHILTMIARAGVSGAVIEETVGEVTQRYSSPISDGKRDQYLATSYGAEYLRLRNTLVFTPMVARPYSK